MAAICIFNRQQYGFFAHFLRMVGRELWLWLSRNTREAKKQAAKGEEEKERRERREQKKKEEDKEVKESKERRVQKKEEDKEDKERKERRERREKEERKEEADKWWGRKMWESELEDMGALAGRSGGWGGRKGT